MQSNHPLSPCLPLSKRFRGFLPVVVDIETSGVNPFEHALLEIAIAIIGQTPKGVFFQESLHSEHILPFEGAIMDPASLAFNQIDPFHPLRFAKTEKVVLQALFSPIFDAIKKTKCQRAVLVGHNAWFDLLFVKEAVQRTGLRSPFHAFTCFDTATLAGFLYGQTVLSKAVQAAGLTFDAKAAHSAIYDCEKTAELFCTMLNDHAKQHPKHL